MTYTYDLPDEIQIEVDGPLRLIRFNRPDDLNAANEPLHTGMARVFTQINEDPEARVVVITGNGRAFSAGGDFEYLHAMSYDDQMRYDMFVDAKAIVTSMVACRVPIVAAVNGPAVGLGCSIVALSDIVYMAESAHLADPHVLVGLVAADGGAITWPLLTSLQLAKEYAFTGDRIPAQRAAQIGLANHVVPDDEVLDAALACAQRLLKVPHQALLDTKRAMNLHLEHAVLNILDYALLTEDRSFTSPDTRAFLDRAMKKREDKQD
jgi:enoyl-CoA hydratase/carnithine racemase